MRRRSLLIAAMVSWLIFPAEALPERVSLAKAAEVKVVRVDREKHEYVYESDNFRFQSNVEFSEPVLREFAAIFESTYQYVKALPLGLGEGDRIEGKYLIRFFETEEEFCKEGGDSDSEGVFVPEQKAVLVPVVSLGLKKEGDCYGLDQQKNQETLIHEVVHQLTPPVCFVQAEDDGWFGEGIAEYIGNTPYHSGTFELKQNPALQVEVAVSNGTQGFSGWKIGKTIKAPHLETFMLLPYEEFTGKKSDFNYGFSILLISYFIHLDGEGDAAALKRYLKALTDGKDTPTAKQALLGGRTWQQLEQEFITKLAKEKIEVDFSLESEKDK